MTLLLIICAVAIFILIRSQAKNRAVSPPKSTEADELEKSSSKRYYYSRKDSVMTPIESRFFNRLVNIAGHKYHVFPQIHLSSLLKNETWGKYHKLAFQRINRRSVDFVLCDKQTMKTVYAIELDDSTHNNPKRRARDQIVEEMLAEGGVPLVRLRHPNKLSDTEIVNILRNVNESSTKHQAAARQ